MLDRLRTTCVDVRPAQPADIDDIVNLWRRYGEDNVDIREVGAVDAAVHSGGLHCFLEGSRLVGTGGFYPYEAGAYTELGSSCWLPEYRGRGGGPVSVCFRVVYASLVEPGTLIVSELYETSTKSFRLLDKLNFEEFPAVARAMHAHAFAANPIVPVRHMVLSPWNVPTCARVLLRALDGERIDGGDLSFAFSQHYNFQDHGIRSQIEQLAAGDLNMIGHELTPPADLRGWMALRTIDGLIGYQEFLNDIRMKPRRSCSGK